MDGHASWWIFIRFLDVMMRMNSSFRHSIRSQLATRTGRIGTRSGRADDAACSIPLHFLEEAPTIRITSLRFPCPNTVWLHVCMHATKPDSCSRMHTPKPKLVNYLSALPSFPTHCNKTSSKRELTLESSSYDIIRVIRPMYVRTSYNIL